MYDRPYADRNITYYIAQSKNNDVVIPGYRLDYKFTIYTQLDPNTIH